MYFGRSAKLAGRTWVDSGMAQASPIARRAAGQGSLDLGYAAIDEDLAGRDEATVVGGQEGGDLRNLLIGSRSGKGRYACRVFHEAVQRVTAGAGVFVCGGADHPRAGRVDPDAPAPQIRRPCPSEVAARRL